jgi:hypothetical protein
LTGCGGGADVFVSGKVTLAGESVAAGTVTFYPADGRGAVAYGQIGADGEYQIQTGAAVGLAPCNYLVSVVAFEVVPNAGPDGLPGSRLLSPERYKDPKTSGLTCTVAPGSNRFDVTLSRP